jgi:hypothetical protein
MLFNNEEVSRISLLVCIVAIASVEALASVSYLMTPNYGDGRSMTLGTILRGSTLSVAM